MKTLIITAGILLTLASCSENKVYNVRSIMYSNEVVISDEALVKGDTVRIGYDLAGREVASKEWNGYSIGHRAVVQ